MGKKKTEWIKYCKYKINDKEECGTKYVTNQRKSKICPECKAMNKRNRMMKMKKKKAKQ